ncbi:MAG: bifunctional acetate--CoA ligase family protein/GNAT family N-acetyltransferase [Sphingomonas sp.]|jgi:acetyltransferase|uniref:bifunctional acetate--CoA ligase family protein/GNAT family N-acetyltransferase n=1 Tax=Sphingomonas sp. TaxID=28214 RepID=UPI003565B2D2
MTVRNLQALLHPRSVAVIGGSQRQGSMGEMVLSNIADGGFEGTIFAVNPKLVEMKGVVWVASVTELPVAPDLAVIVTPAATVATIVGELGALGTKVAVIVSAGLHDPVTRQAILDAAKPHMLRIVGPNCLGALLPHAKLDASFAPRAAVPGGLAFVSQSGALVTAMLDWAAAKNIGFSGVVSVGDMVDVDLGDLIDLFAADPKTDAILLYIEGVTNPAKFMSAARAASRIKPVIAIKAGRTDAAGKAATSHTGALTGAYDVHAAAFRRAGIILVDSLTELFDAAQMLSRHRPWCGERLAIVTNGGGAGVLAADALPASGGTLAALTPETIAALDPVLPASWSRANPIDVVGDARPERFASATRAALADPGVDAVLVVHCPTAAATGTDIAQAVIATVAERVPATKPVIACWLGTHNADAARAAFDAAGIALFDNLDDAVRGFGYLLQASKGRDAVMRAPAHVTVAEGDRARVRAILTGARGEGRTILTGCEVRSILGAYGIPVVEAVLARTIEAIPSACARVSAPYVLKLISPQFPHKSDIGGVALNLASEQEAVAAAHVMVRRLSQDHPRASITGFEIEPMIAPAHGRELLVGIAEDSVFGPVIAFGAGGKAVELIRDRALGLPPLDDVLAEDMIASTRIARLLDGYRDVPPANRMAIVAALNALSALVLDFPEIVELDINPLVVDEAGAIGVDARARISGAPRASRAVIRPVPMEWARDLTTRDGVGMRVRPVKPGDEAALAEFFRHVTPEDLRFRFLTGLHEVGHDRLVAMTQIDYRRTMNFLAFAGDGLLIATAMLACDPDGVRAELAISVRADFKGRGVSWTLLQHVLAYARAEGIETVESVESSDNHAALKLEREAGFEAVPSQTFSTEVTVRRKVETN